MRKVMLIAIGILCMIAQGAVAGENGMQVAGAQLLAAMNAEKVLVLDPCKVEHRCRPEAVTLLEEADALRGLPRMQMLKDATYWARDRRLLEPMRDPNNVWLVASVSLARKRANCIQWAAVVRTVLREAGIPDEDMKILVNAAHAVLQVSVDGEYYILDIRSPLVVSQDDYLRVMNFKIAARF
ncbi:MAG: transglutaminase-like domain-containing protein [Patescibacteria group bacterium]